MLKGDDKDNKDICTHILFWLQWWRSRQISLLLSHHCGRSKGQRERGGGGGLEKTCHVLPKVSRKASGSSLSLFEKIGDLRSCRNNPFIQHIPPLPLACQCDLP